MRKTPTPKKTAPPEEVPSFTLADVDKLPDRESVTSTRIFEIDGRKWKVSVRSLFTGSAEDFYRVMKMLTPDPEPAGKSAAFKPIEVTSFTGKKVTVDTDSYAKSLEFLATVTVDPKFGFDGWALFGNKVGGLAMEEIFTWAGEVNGFSKELVDKMIDQAKN